MNIEKQIATKNRCYQTGRTITIKGLMLHSVGCPQPSGQVFANRMNSAGAKVCVHAFIDANDGKVYQILPWNHRAWHCGGNANNTHISVEMCEPSCIKYTGGSKFSCSDTQKALVQVKTALASAVELFAFLCKEYNLNPLEDGVIISHKEGHDRGVASEHADPDHLFRQLGMNYSMNDFRREVAAKMGTVATSNIAEIQEKLTVSQKCVELVAKYEGCRLKAYKCPAGVWTIGYGHTAGVVSGMVLPSKEMALELLKDDLKKYATSVNNCVKNGTITFALNQNQFDALTSFCYNCGAGNLQRLVKGRSASEVAEKLMAYTKGGGKVLPGLVRRREEERELFLS